MTIQQIGGLPAGESGGVPPDQHVATSDPLSLAQARDLVLSAVTRLPPRRCGLDLACGLVLACDVVAADNVPRFANSAMDGYAVRAADTEHAPVSLRVTGTIAAGQNPRSPVAPGEAVRIMTGAPMPVGADAVCKVEDTGCADGGSTVIIGKQVSAGENVRYPGEDIAAGSVVFPAGTRLGPAHIGALASIGAQTVLAHPGPVVGVLSTGDELVSGGGVVDLGHIRDANRPALLAQVAVDGHPAVDLGVVADDETELSAALHAAARRCDVIVASGGVSVGDHDALKVVLGKLGGGSMHAMDVAVKPGRHIAFAQIGSNSTLTFGLPGNPVAALVAYELFVRPALRATAGHVTFDRPRLSAIAEADLRRRPGPKLHLVRVAARPDERGRLRVRPSGGQDSHMLKAMAGANALALLPDGHGVLAGDEVEILLLDADLS